LSAGVLRRIESQLESRRLDAGGFQLRLTVFLGLDRINNLHARQVKKYITA
jgi:hypothetical protein